MIRKTTLPVAALAALVLASPAAAVDPPETSGRAAIVVDARDGHVMHAESARAGRPIASATKLMTALLVLERAKLGDVLKAADYAAAPVESKINLQRGERMTVRDLLTALLLESANDAAVTLAKGVAGSPAAFVREMNRRAVALGLRQTSYANPIGFDDRENYSSARDLAKLARLLLRSPVFARIVNMPRARLSSGNRTRLIENRNRLVASYPFVSGVKTGHTLGAGYVLVGSGERRGAEVITVTLGAPSESARDADTLTLLRWGLSRFERRSVLVAEQPLDQLDVRYRDEDADVGAASGVSLLVREDERTRVRLEGEPDSLEGPLAKGDRVGTVAVRRRRRTVRRVPLVTLEDIDEAGFLTKLASAPGGLFLTLLACLGIVASAMLFIRSRRRHR